jgi:hypothetical protein
MKHSSDERKARPVFRVIVHWECVWIDGNAVSLPARKMQKLVKMFLDSGVPVRGYWKNCDYRSIDKRISSEGGRE